MALQGDALAEGKTAPPVAAWDETARPRQREGIELRVVASKREGTRHVLADRARGHYLELRGGERDVLVWERLDGRRTLRDVGLELVEATGSFPRDLGRFVARLQALGFVEVEGAESPPPPPRAPLASRLLRFFVPLPGVGSLLGTLARALRFLGSPWIFGLLGVLGLVGAVLTTTGILDGKLLPEGDDLLPGLGALLLVNAAVAALECFGRAIILARSQGDVARAGIAFTAGIPEPALDVSAEAVLPVEGRALLRVAPLPVALFLGGGATAALFAIGTGSGAHGAGVGSSPEALLVVPWLERLAWVGLLRALVHASPFGPGALYEAVRAWLHVDELRAAAARFFAHDFVHLVHHRSDDGGSVTARESVFVVYGGLALAWTVLAARVVASVVLRELAPRIHEIVPASSRSGTLGHAFFLLVLLLPLALVASSLVFALTRAIARGIARSTFGTPAGAGVGAALIAVTIAAGGLPLGPREGAILAAFVGAAGSWLALRASNTDGRGRAALALTLAAVAGALAALASGLAAETTGARGQGAETVARLIAGTREACGLALLAASLLEIATVTRSARIPGVLGAVLAGAVGVTCVASAFLPGLLPAGVGLGSAGLLGAALATILFGVSALLSLGSLRPTSRALLALAALGLAVAELARPSAGGGFVKVPEQELVAHVAAILWPGLLGAASIARGRERRARGYSLPLDLVEPSASEDEVLDSVLAPLAETVHEHLGVGAAVALGREVAGSTGKGVEERALVMLRGCRAVAGERYLARYLEAALERVPSNARLALARRLEPVPALADLGQRIAEGCEPDLATRGGLFRSVPLLSPLSDDEVFELAALGVRERVAAGHFVVREGEEGDRFYVIAEGSAEVTVAGRDGTLRTVAHLHAGDAFGEAALLRHEPRTASVRATVELTLLAVGRDVFLEFVKPRKEVLGEIIDRLEDVWLLRSIALFAELESAQVAQLFQRCFDAVAEPNTAIVRQGERGDRFFVIRDGVVRVEVDDGRGAKRVIAHLSRGDYFGEMALLHDSPRTATVISETRVELVGLGREDFLRLLRGEARVRLEEASAARSRALGTGPTPTAPAPKVQAPPRPAPPRETPPRAAPGRPAPARDVPERRAPEPEVPDDEEDETYR